MGGLPGLCTGDDQGDATHQRNGAEEGWDGDGAGLLVLDLEWTEVYVFLFVTVAEASYGKAGDADNNQNEANDGGRFHKGGRFS